MVNTTKTEKTKITTFSATRETLLLLEKGVESGLYPSKSAMIREGVRMAASGPGVIA